MQKSTQNTHASGSPAPIVSSGDALAAAKANADAIARQLTTSDLTHDGRADLAYDLRAALGQIDAIEQAQR